MSVEFASASLTAGQLNAIVKKLGGHEMALRFLRGEFSVSHCSWREEDGVIFFSVTSDGTEGADWIKRLEGKGLRVMDYAKTLLRSADFKPTTGITTEVAVLKDVLFESHARTTKNILVEAVRRKLQTPNAEIVCLICEQFTNKEIEAMGLRYIIAMHEPIVDTANPYFLSVCRGERGSWLSAGAYCARPDYRWDRGNGFAFAVSQVSPQF